MHLLRLQCHSSLLFWGHSCNCCNQSLAHYEMQ
jgi:hypothetical protein